MVASSHPRATRAGLAAFARGGNAADAALAAAAMLCVAEPMNCGPGGDAFALVWNEGEVEVLDAAGPAPLDARPLAPVDLRGSRSVTVPGAVAGWNSLAARYGRLGFDRCLGDAITAAKDGIRLTPRMHALWTAEDPCPEGFAPRKPMVGERIRLPALARTLHELADNGPDLIYRGALAERIAAASWLDRADLECFAPRWREPLCATYRGHQIYEAPPPTQGVAALEAFRLLEPHRPSFRNQVWSVTLALDDAQRVVRDGADVSELLDDGYLRRRSTERAAPLRGIDAGTSFVCAIDGDRMAVSLIQSLFGSFGSGVLVPDTGIILQNRGAWFALSGSVEPGRRPYHTIIPALLAHRGELAGAFGVVGGSMQPQGHVQLISGIIDEEMNPQAVLDRGRFRVDASTVSLEEDLWEQADELEGLGLRVVLDSDWIKFGAGQVILVENGRLLGGSDRRMDGYAAGA